MAAFEFSCVDSIAGASPRSLAAEPCRKVLAAGSPASGHLLFSCPRIDRTAPATRTRKYFRKERLGQPTRSEAQLVLSVGAGLDKLAIGAGLDGIRRFHMNSSKQQGRLAFQAPRLS